MTILCERRKLSQEELVALRPVFLEWRRREREKDLLMVEQIQNEEDIKEEELEEIDQREENCRIEYLEVLFRSIRFKSCPLVGSEPYKCEKYRDSLYHSPFFLVLMGFLNI